MGDCHASLLPLEAVIHLLEFLPYPDRVAASQVCHTWYEACLHPHFLNQEKVVIKKSALEALAILKNTCRPYYHFMLLEVEMSSKMKAFWLNIAPDLKSIYFGNCDMYDKMFIEVLSKCWNLESLVLDNCRELFMPGSLLENPEDIVKLSKALKQLKELNLTFNRYLSDAMFNRLMSTMPNLHTISLEGCQVVYHAGLFKKFYPDKLTLDNADYASETVLTFWNFYNIILKRAEKIKSINLSRTLVDSSALSIISEIKPLKLEELHVVACEQLTNAAILSLAQHQSVLRVLDMSYCSRITDQALIHICGNLIHLRKLWVRNCRAITDLGIVQLKNLVNLEELNISQCEQITGGGIQNGLCHKVNGKMRRLYMAGLNMITPSTVSLLAEALPLLTELNLSYCFNAVTDQSVQAIFQHQVKLRSLTLASCDSLTDGGLTGMGMGASVSSEVAEIADKLDCLAGPGPAGRLHISLRSRAEDEIIRDAYRKQAVQRMCESQLGGSSSVGYSLARLRGLQKLDLSNCNKITDVSLKYSFHFIELQCLNLSQCQQITVEGLKAVGENNPSIDTLSLGHCYNICDESIHTLACRLRRLKYLDIKGCNQLSDAAIDSIVEHCSQLRYLDASFCNSLADKIAATLHKLPRQTLFNKCQVEIVPAPRLPPAPPPH